MEHIIYLAASEGTEACRYEFFCMACGCRLILLTGLGRYGNLGAFRCPGCQKHYYATRDDYIIGNAYIYEHGSHPTGYLSGNKDPLITLRDQYSPRHPMKK